MQSENLENYIQQYRDNLLNDVILFGWKTHSMKNLGASLPVWTKQVKCMIPTNLFGYRTVRSGVFLCCTTR